jgi:hypothetical protein
MRQAANFAICPSGEPAGAELELVNSRFMQNCKTLEFGCKPAGGQDLKIFFDKLEDNWRLILSSLRLKIVLTNWLSLYFIFKPLLRLKKRQNGSFYIYNY